MARYHLDDEVNWDATSILARCKAVGSFGVPGQHACPGHRGPGHMPQTPLHGRSVWPENSIANPRYRQENARRQTHATILCAETASCPPTRGYNGKSDVRQV